MGQKPEISLFFFFFSFLFWYIFDNLCNPGANMVTVPALEPLIFFGKSHDHWLKSISSIKMISGVVENVIWLRNCKRKMFSEVGVSTEQWDADQCIPAHCFWVASQYSEVYSSFSSIIIEFIVLNSCYANNATSLYVVLSVLQLHHAYGNTTLPTHPHGVYWCQRMR